MNDKEYSQVRRKWMKDWKYSRLVGIEGGLEILLVRWQGCMIGNTQV